MSLQKDGVLSQSEIDALLSAITSEDDASILDDYRRELVKAQQHITETLIQDVLNTLMKMLIDSKTIHISEVPKLIGSICHIKQLISIRIKEDVDTVSEHIKIIRELADQSKWANEMIRTFTTDQNAADVIWKSDKEEILAKATKYSKAASDIIMTY